MAHDVLDGRKRKCTCYVVGTGEEGPSLQCYAKGAIGTLTDSQEETLCIRSRENLINSAEDATPDMVHIHNKFRDGLKRAEEDYEEYQETHVPSIEKWLDILRGHLREGE